MFRKYFAEISNDDFKNILEAATDDIKFNRIGFNKKTSLDEAISIMEICRTTANRCKEVSAC